MSDDLDLQRFMKIESASPQILKAQLNYASPVMRYALRLSLAMLAGYLLTLVFPQYIHGGWGPAHHCAYYARELQCDASAAR
ncbi:MAG: hypothetical protein WDM89_04895 [Rhizomicrobium sp.]